MSKYWERYWNTADRLNTPILQTQVGRTVSGQPVDEAVWANTVAYVLDALRLEGESRVLELCCGNGLLTLPMAQRVKQVVAVDISAALIEMLQDQIGKQGVSNIVPLCGDALRVRFEKGRFTHVFMYFALQHFSEREALLLFKKAYDWLEDGGRFFLGDIPDAERKWQFVNTKEYERMYFDSIKSGQPAIGSWFDKIFLEKLARYTGFQSAVVSLQPAEQINSHYRFDFTVQK
jgi:cyclopropane fatty-acyl-phospholipid synthase-like methyltransferase